MTKTHAKHQVIFRDKFLSRTRDALWVLSVIELAKIFGSSSENDNFSIKLIIKKLRRYHLNSVLETLISSEDLKAMERLFRTPEMKSRIDKLQEVRSQHFAHSDKRPDNNIYDIKFYFEDSIHLIDLAEKIVFDLSLKILEKPIRFSEYRGEEMDSFLDQYLECIKLAGRYNLGQVKTE